MKIKNLKITFSTLLIALQGVTQTPIPTDKPEVIFVKGGTFQMGNDSGEKDDEKPAHSVTISDFSIGKYPVTVGQYKMFCEATRREMPNEPRWGWNDNHPMVNINYKDAISYCDWLNKKYGGNWRLPTEAEWEYTSRGGNQSRGHIYSGNSDLEAVAWHYKNSGGQTQDVGRKKPNELGIYDMSGNVWEWCNDFYSANYYTYSPKDNPKGAGPYTSGPHDRVLRGGSWYSDSSICRVTFRHKRGSSDRWYDYGFRVVFTP